MNYYIKIIKTLFKIKNSFIHTDDKTTGTRLPGKIKSHPPLLDFIIISCQNNLKYLVTGRKLGYS